MSAGSQTQRPSEARDRLLRTAGSIFYAKGINSVGVEEIVSAARVTRATFYRHFPSKEDLIVAYLRDIDRQIRAEVDALVSRAGSADDAIREVANFIARSIKSPTFRGCAFLNAAAEYPDRDSPVYQVVLDSREWLLQTMTGLFSRALDMPAESTARHFVMLRDGAMASGCLSDPDSVCEVFLRGVDGYLVYHRTVADR